MCRPKHNLSYLSWQEQRFLPNHVGELSLSFRCKALMDWANRAAVPRCWDSGGSQKATSAAGALEASGSVPLPSPWPCWGAMSAAYAKESLLWFKIYPKKATSHFRWLMTLVYLLGGTCKTQRGERSKCMYKAGLMAEKPTSDFWGVQFW